jgi:hypothetical protein
VPILATQSGVQEIAEVGGVKLRRTDGLRSRCATQVFQKIDASRYRSQCVEAPQLGLFRGSSFGSEARDVERAKKE